MAPYPYEPYKWEDILGNTTSSVTFTTCTGTVNNKSEYKMKKQSQSIILIITGIVIILAIAEIIHFAVYWGIKL